MIELNTGLSISPEHVIVVEMTLDEDDQVEEGCLITMLNGTPFRTGASYKGVMRWLGEALPVSSPWRRD